MSRRFVFLSVALLFGLLTSLFRPISTRADTFFEPRYAGTAYDLINAVNALRAAYGLPPYSINSILMYTAQAQADFMAANGTVTHSGPGGIGVTERLLAAGYPLAGDLSLGGFRSENITGGAESKSAQAAVDQWTGDTLHLNTMISPDLTEIGAGVTVTGGRVYYVIDCARPVTAGAPQISITPVGGGSAVPASEMTVQPLQPVVVSTQNSEGNIIHEVKYGQSLWQIAISYDTKIDEIKRLNNLSGDDIYPGEKLLIKTGIAAATLISTETSTPEATITANTVHASVTSTIMIPASDPVTLTPVAAANPSQSSMTTYIVIGIIALAVLGGGIISWMGLKKSDN